jgi:hypothetical protein
VRHAALDLAVRDTRASRPGELVRAAGLPLLVVGAAPFGHPERAGSLAEHEARKEHHQLRDAIVVQEPPGIEPPSLHNPRAGQGDLKRSPLRPL